jgi:hypothetical protein
MMRCSDSRSVNHVRRCWAIGALSVVLVAGCTATAQPESRSATSTVTITHTQVISWVTPTLANGASFVRSVSPSATAGQVFAASRPLNAGATVALHDLARISWTGALQPSENELVEALQRIASLTAVPPGPGYVDHLQNEIHRAQGALQGLTRDIKS